MTTAAKQSSLDPHSNYVEADWTSMIAVNPWLKAAMSASGAHAALTGIALFESSLRNSRAILDSWKSVVRMQQDLAIGLVREHLGAPAVISAETGKPMHETLLWPLVAAESAYEDGLKALVRTQRDIVKYAAEANGAAR
jgi:hypothetical protein